MKLREVLLKHTKVGDLVLINDGGWYIGCTIIDAEDLFIRSLDHKLLEREVKEFKYEPVEWSTKQTMKVYL